MSALVSAWRRDGCGEWYSVGAGREPARLTRSSEVRSLVDLETREACGLGRDVSTLPYREAPACARLMCSLACTRRSD